MATDKFKKERETQKYEKITYIDGVQTTMCINRFEIVAKDKCEINELQALKAFRQWLVWRYQEKLPKSGDMPE